MIEGLIEQKFNRLTIKKFIGKKITKKGNMTKHFYWECQCDCGKIVSARLDSLKSENIKSCGCLGKEIRKNIALKMSQSRILPNEESGFNQVINAYKKGAKERNLSFYLSKETCKELFKKNCYYCNEPPSNKIKLSHNRNFIYSGIDRINNDEGYEETNVIPCCVVCNKMKNKKTFKDFLLHIEKIYKFMELEEDWLYKLTWEPRI